MMNADELTTESQAQARPASQAPGLIQFQAITPGLGFHPFSDGLPYAPISKNTSSGRIGTALNGAARATGSGAVTAGPPSYALSHPARPVPPRTARSPRVSVPVATPAPAPSPAPAQYSEPSLQKPLPGPSQTQTSQPRTSTASQTSLNIRIQPAGAGMESPLAFAAPTFGYVYLLKRILAYSLDTALNSALLAAGLSVALWNQDLNPEILANPGVIVISFGFFMLFNWALVTAQEIAFGTSVGKRIFGLALSGSASAIFLRAFFFLPSLGFCGIGLLWSLVDSRKRCWHDLVINVQPQELARL